MKNLAVVIITLIGSSCLAQTVNDPTSQQQQQQQPLDQSQQVQQQIQQQEIYSDSKTSNRSKAEINRKLNDIKLHDKLLVRSTLIVQRTISGECVTDVATIGPGAIIEIFEMKDGNFIFQVDKNNIEDITDPKAPPAVTGIPYCIKAKILGTYSNKLPTGDFSISLLAIPFKFQYKSYNIHPGGSLGGFFGYRRYSQKKPDQAVTFGAFAGLSSVPQNNDASTTNASDIKVIPAFGF